MRLYRFEASSTPGSFTVDKAPGLLFTRTQYGPNEFCKKFLSLKPRPTIEELLKALHPLGWNLQKYKSGVLDPDKPGYLKYDPDGYKKLLEEETQKRREYMQQVIDSRTKTNPA